MQTRIILSDNVRDAHLAAIRLVSKRGKYISTEDRELTLELPHPLLVHVERPLDEPRILDEVGIGRMMMQEYSKQMRTVTSTTFSYTYGNRLLDYDGINQLQHVIDKINQADTTRRAVMHTWKVQQDISGEHVPCMQMIQFLCRDDKINCSVVFRSHDILMAWGANVYAIGDMMKVVADGTCSSVGSLDVFSICPHIYAMRDQSTLHKITRMAE